MTFPENYMSPLLAGRPAEFDVKVKAIAAPGPINLDDEFSKGFGFETLEAMKDAVRGKMGEDLSRASRDRLKRVLLDALDKRYDFALPEGLVSQEFDNIWRQIAEEQKQSGRSFADEETTEDEARAEYRRIAERRVRLGLVLAEVGEKAGVKVEDAEVGRALVEMARQYPGQEQKIWDYYQKNAQALSEIKAPLFEDKVVDLIVSKANVTDRVVPKDELFKLQDDEEAEAKTARPTQAALDADAPAGDAEAAVAEAHD